MTIKEAEARSGVARANIRYYEAEGLLAPQRLSNGYRTYSEADLALLEKIKLLRRLGVTLEELRALERGGAQLSQVLDRRLGELEGEQAGLRRVERICGELREAGAAFDTLEPGRYLEALDAPSPPEDPALSPPPLPASDTLPVVTGLGRRLAARCLDWFLLWNLLLTAYALSGRNINRLLEGGLLLVIALEVLLLLLESLLIHLLGTTPGKALLGLRLTRMDGEHLTFGEAASRHVWMLWGAFGLGLPIWSWIQIYKCCKRWSDGEPQPWDEGIAYTAAPFGRRRFFRLALVCLAVLAAAETANSFSQLPPRRGGLTVADFSENYNRQAAFLNGSVKTVLNPEGVFVELPDPPGTYSVSVTEDWQERAFQYTLEGNALRAVTLVCRAENAKGWLSLPLGTVSTAVTAFAWAPRETPFFTFGRKPLLKALAEADWSRDFSLEKDGVSVTWEIQSRNFDVSDGMALAFPRKEGENTLACRCTIALTG